LLRDKLSVSLCVFRAPLPHSYPGYRYPVHSASISNSLSRASSWTSDGLTRTEVALLEIDHAIEQHNSFFVGVQFPKKELSKKEELLLPSLMSF
jgi:hypothetical protein